MEFGIFLLGYNPEYRRGSETPEESEHRVFFEDIKLAIAAEQAGFKYVWASEHHFLDEYSHLSASDVVLSYLAHATTTIHLGAGIFNPLPTVNHPVKVAERVAMLDHLTEGRFEFGTGRGAGSHEILGFLPGHDDLSKTRDIWEETIGEFAKMWTQDEYEGFQGRYWSLPPRRVLPKPWKKPHPPMWYAAGNPSSWEMAGRKGLGVLGFSIGQLDQVEPLRTRYKKALASAEPVGAYVNDNLLVCTSAVSVNEDSQRAKEALVRARPNYMVTQSLRYHDTFPRPAGIPEWPNQLPDVTLDDVGGLIESGAICGNPDEALEQCRRWESTGIDQLIFGVGGASFADTMTTLRLLGEHVIPKLDTEPIHRTTRLRDAAAGLI